MQRKIFITKNSSPIAPILFHTQKHINLGIHVIYYIPAAAVVIFGEQKFPRFYARKQLPLSARLSHRNSVRLSARLSDTWVDQSKMVQARLTKSLLTAAWKTLVSGTVRLFHKFEGGHPEPERGR